MTEFQVIPIFNQSAPGVWDDFLRIRCSTMLTNYQVPMSSLDIERALKECATNWAKYSGSYAFGAYDLDGQMIGVIDGRVYNGIGSVNHLHVLPEYQGQHIGRILLNNAERAASAIRGRRMELISLVHAEKFYQASGYQNKNLNEYFKKLSLPRCATVPVFHCCPDMAVHCNMSPDMTKQKNQHRMPMFVYYDDKSQVLGNALIDSSNNVQISVNSDCFFKKLVQRDLERASERFLLHQSRKTR